MPARLRPRRYRFIVAGRLDPADEAVFDGLAVGYERDTTTLSGIVLDAKGLMAIMSRIIELELILLGMRADEPPT